MVPERFGADFELAGKDAEQLGAEAARRDS